MSRWLRNLSLAVKIAAEDIIGRIQLQLLDWKFRRPAAEIMEDVRQRTADPMTAVRESTTLTRSTPTSCASSIGVMPGLSPVALRSRYGPLNPNGVITR